MPFRIFDAHCDTLAVDFRNREKCDLKIDDMRGYDGYTQVFAICPVDFPAFSYTKKLLRRYDAMLRKSGFTPILFKDDLDADFGAILALEGADALCGSLAALKFFYRAGVRLITLTWNNNNAAASSIASEKDGGLTLFGRKLALSMRDMGMVIDVSHLGEKGFFDLAELIDTPFVASHSNARAICPHKRNLTDEQFKTLIEHGGVAGINFFTDFIGGEKDTASVIAHIEHFCGLGGEKNIGLGSDFDGVDGNLPRGCSGASYMSDLLNELLRLNYPEKTIRGIARENFYNCFKKILV